MKKPKDFDKMMDLLHEIDDASKPYDGPITILPPTLEMRMNDIAHRRKQMKEAYERCAPQRDGNLPDWDKIEAFLGYGNVNAKVVFIGMEEGLAEPAKLKNDLLYRSTFGQPVMDVYEAHLGLAKGTKLFGDRPRKQNTWRGIADIMMHFDNVVPKNKKEREKRRRVYRANVLGDIYDHALLLELLPYPNVSSTDWPSDYAERYRSRNEYKREMTEKRLDPLREVLFSHKRDAVICYGHEHWDEFKRLFPDDTSWERRRGSLGEYLLAEVQGAKVLLVNHFVTKYLTTDEQLDELAAVALPQRSRE